MSKKISPKLLVLCQLFYPELVSTGQTLTELCEMLVDMGVDIEVVCGPLTYVDRESLISKYIEYYEIRISRVWGTRFSKLNINKYNLKAVAEAYYKIIANVNKIDFQEEMK